MCREIFLIVLQDRDFRTGALRVFKRLTKGSLEARHSCCQRRENKFGEHFPEKKI